MNKRIVLLLIILFACPICISAGRDKAIVLYVIDGDTLKISYHGRKESVRLIGIDAPETRKNKKAYKDSKRSSKDINAIISQGRLAKKYAKSLVKKGAIVTLQFDIEKRDRYRRLLGYIYLPDGRMLNDLMIRNGYASPLTIPPNTKYKNRFLRSYRYAREHGLGLWK
jgi:micrococcal nuclease